MSVRTENLIGSQWITGDGPVTRDIVNPADTSEKVASIQEASIDQVDQAVTAAANAFPTWAAVPAPDRAKILFKYKELLEKNFLDLAKLVVKENGKLLSEAKGSVRRGLDVVEFACGAPSQLMGKSLNDIARNVDSHVTLEPLGVTVGIPPFNFPAMIPLWSMPISIVCGNTYILKPSEKVPLCSTRLVELFVEAGLPEGVVNVVQGGKDVSERLITHPKTKAVSFVGSSAVAESVYKLSAEHGKRVQALGGGKNHLFVMPDADLDKSIPALVGSCYGCAGQRCLAGSVIVAVGDKARQDEVVSKFVEGVKSLKVGDGMDESSTLPPVVNNESQERILSWIDKGEKEGAKVLVDGRGVTVDDRPNGCFVGATVFDNVTPDMEISKEEIFGPVVTVLRAKELNEAIDMVNTIPYGNSASIFTQSGAAARTFRARIQCGMLGLNLGVPAPMAFFSFGGWNKSLYGDLHQHGPDSVAFFTRKKVVTERWFGAEAPKEGWV